MNKKTKALIILFATVIMILSLTLHSSAYEYPAPEEDVTEGIPVSYYREISVIYYNFYDIPQLYYYSEYINGTFADGFLSLYSITTYSGYYRALFKGYIVGPL